MVKYNVYFVLPVPGVLDSFNFMDQLNNEIHKKWNSINIDETTYSNVVQCICHGVSSTIALYILN